MRALLLIAFLFLIGHVSTVHAGTLLVDGGIDFGPVQVGSSMNGEPVFITNKGTPTTLTLPLQLSGPDASRFSIIAQPVQVTLNDGESVSFTVAFSPQTPGSHSAFVIVNSNATNPSVQVNFTGSGVPNPPQPSPVSSAFTYQGKLTDGGAAANGPFDLNFRLWDLEAAGAQIGSELTRQDVQVSGGIFTVTLDFGASPFATGTGNYLEISVRPGASTGSYTLLSPRQPITSSPYAVHTIRAESAATADNANALGGMAASSFVQTTDARLSDARQPQAGSANYIQNGTGVQPLSNFNISGNGGIGGTLTASDVDSGSGYMIGSNRVLRIGGNDNDNTFVGVSAGPPTGSVGGRNTFLGQSAGASISVGSNNTFIGHAAGTLNTTGSANTIVGRCAGCVGNLGNNNSFFGSGAGTNTTGDMNLTGAGNSFFGTSAGATNVLGRDNTAIGRGADVTTSSLGNATAIGALARVSQSNSIVLGAIAGIGGSGFSTQVGIGTTAPRFRFHVRSDGQDGIKIQHTGAGSFPQLRWTDASDNNPASIGVDTGGTGSMNFFLNGADRFVITNTGLVRALGGIFISNPNTLVITSPDGACWGITVSNAGALSTFSTACP